MRKMLRGLCISFVAMLATPQAYAEDVQAVQGASPTTLENGKTFNNPTGQSSSFSTAGSVDLTGSFFQNLGTNGRTCETCHFASDGWTVSAKTANELFERTGGLHPLFEFDGQNCLGADRSTREARKAASSLMINKALVRFDKMFPADGEIEITAAEGTYCNETDSLNHVVFRRPLPTVNLGAFGTSLWDGFGNTFAPNVADVFPLLFVGATLVHAQATAVPTQAQIDQANAMMFSLTNAQIADDDAGKLDVANARGGAENHASANLTGAPGFNIFDAWLDLPGNDNETMKRKQIARGQTIFNTRLFQISGVGGLSDRMGTCAGCHRVPNQGNQATFNTLNIGTSSVERRTPDLPLYTLRKKGTMLTVQTTDAGTAIFTGRWADIGKFKVPMIRGLAARAPYFHDGSAKDIAAVVDFYNNRFNIKLSDNERKDLIAFLEAL